MKKTITLFTALLLSMLPLLALAGPYVGTAPAANGNKLTKETEKLIGGQVFAGYKLDKKAGVEMGYSLYSNKEKLDLDKMLDPVDEILALTFTYNFD